MEKLLRNAVMEQLLCAIDHGNYGMLSTRRVSLDTFHLLATNCIRIKGNKVLQNGIEVAKIERRYASRKVCGMYKELKPKVTWL